MITKCKKGEIEIQSSRKLFVIRLVIYFLFVLIIGTWMFLMFKTNDNYNEGWKFLVLITLILFVDLFYTDWTISTKNDTLYVRKWIFKFKIPFKDLIELNNYTGIYRDSITRLASYLIIKYRKEDKIRNLKVVYSLKRQISNKDHEEKIKIEELCNHFMSGIQEFGIEHRGYEEIRTKQEQMEMNEFYNRKKDDEQKVISIVLGIVILIFIGFIGFLILEGSK